MAHVILFNKPYNVLSQFTDTQGRETLKNYIPYNKVYPAGRLDRDSEGLLLLTDDGKRQHLIANPRNKMSKSYWVQVEGIPSDTALQQLCEGVMLKDGLTQPAKAKIIDSPWLLWPRTPPIRVRKSISDCWLEITIKEGKNRQVRRMTAAINHPTLRLIRYRIGSWTIDGLNTGQYSVQILPKNK
ncbi:MAG TPA: pseudouridine synthase [Thiothrix sp.]|nr:pseudouridine synthase [Thiothrix sp.]